MKNNILILLLAVALCLFVLAAGCTDAAGSNSTPAPQSLPEEKPANSNPDTVPVGTAYNQTLSTFWNFAIEGPYSSNPNWTTAALDPGPAVLYDVNGAPLYYEFYLRNNGTAPGFFWTVADKRLGHGVFRIFESPPPRNRTLLMTEAEPVVEAEYPGYTVIAKKTVLYSDPYSGTMFTILNRTSGAEEEIIVDDYSHEVLPFPAPPGYEGRIIAQSVLDGITESDYADRRIQWQLQDSNASRIVDYARARGIDVRLPLSGQNASILKQYNQPEYPDTAAGQVEPSGEREERPVTDELIDENVVPVEAARDHALVKLWHIVTDRPDTYAGRSWRNARMSTKEPAVIEDFDGRNLYYVFSVERNGDRVSDIIITANKGLYSHRFGLETPAGEYDLTNATRIARERAVQDYPRETVRSVRPVYSLADNCCHNVTVILETEDPVSREVHRILVDTYTLEVSTGPAVPGNETDANPSIFSEVTPGDFADNCERWEDADDAVRNLTVFAERSGISRDRPLTSPDVVTLGTYIFRTETTIFPELYDPVNPAPGPRPILDKRVQAWHDRADWITGFYVGAATSDAEIGQIVSGYVPSGYRLKIFPAYESSGSFGYCLDIPGADYNRTFSLLREDGGVYNFEVEYNWDFVREVKQTNGGVRIPLVIANPIEANFLRLSANGRNLTPMKSVYIEYTSRTEPDKAEREKILTGLDADNRVLFAFKEYPG
ncbi:MAG: hypothetical protein LUQ71_06750 [Methanoregula sp.]|nr:hypothetical protein [Methanoregula sp.]